MRAGWSVSGTIPLSLRPDQISFETLPRCHYEWSLSDRRALRGRKDPLLSGYEALERLREGNRRFASTSTEPLIGRSRPLGSATEQRPFAVILGCSDSRVPVEIIFDQGLGDLFVVRVAGNIVAPSQVGSVEFAAERFGTRLVVVLGHTECGAVQATLENLQAPSARPSGDVSSIVNRIRPAVEDLLKNGEGRDPDIVMRDAVRANVRVAANHLRHGSGILERLIQRSGLIVVGAEYSLETGAVEFFDGVSGTAVSAHEVPG
ncbi:carbonic anhydrase [soil metagenome]